MSVTVGDGVPDLLDEGDLQLRLIRAVGLHSSEECMQTPIQELLDLGVVEALELLLGEVGHLWLQGQIALVEQVLVGQAHRPDSILAKE